MNLNTERILLLDGAMGTMIQEYGLDEGNNEYLNLSHPEIIKEIHLKYIAAGADIIESNTFSANRISQKEYGCENIAAEMAYEGARIAREAADEAESIAAGIGAVRKVWVAGSMGPTSKSLTLAPDGSDPSFRPYGFDEMKEAYREQAEALLKGGADMLLLETCFDALNVKAAISAIEELSDNNDIPLMISVSVGDRSGRTLTGQTIEAFHTAVSHYPLLSFGLNCSLGAGEMKSLIEEIDKFCTCLVSCYPNAGLPDEMGRYLQSPEKMAEEIRIIAGKGIVNIVGGCCGTTPEHIRAIRNAVGSLPPRKMPLSSNILKISGLEAVEIDTGKRNFTNIGERSNVAGSKKFASLIASGNYDEALAIAARQIEDGASVIDINMDDAMLDSTAEMQCFLRYASNEPDVAKAAIMIDSSHWDTILAGLKNIQGKGIVNSISLKDGEEEFLRRARSIRSFGAAMVVMAFDEQGQATTYDRKIEICRRAYTLLTEKAMVPASDIIFDANILSIGTGIKEHENYAVDFIEAVKWIKANLPGALTSGGVSNLSFAFRGNNSVREALHSSFLYHAVKAGLDMAIVNPSMLKVYDEIEPELLRCVEDVIFNRDPEATERLIAKAGEIKDSGKKGPCCIASAQLQSKPEASVSELLKESIIRGRSEGLKDNLMKMLEELSDAAAVIEGPLMAGMAAVGEMFGDGRMFLPQVVKSAKVMRDAVEILEPYLAKDPDEGNKSKRPKVVLATVKGDVHDIGKNITGTVLTCNGFDVHDLGVMVDKESIISEALSLKADIIAVSGLITPSLYHMEELCREMSARKMDTLLLIGGATTSALHTAVKLAPLYGHVYYGANASTTAVMAKRYMISPDEFEKEQHMGQERLREMHEKAAYAEAEDQACRHDAVRLKSSASLNFRPKDIISYELPVQDAVQFFDWRMFHAIWGVRYGSFVPEVPELMQLRRDAEDELEYTPLRISISARFLMANSSGDNIVCDDLFIPCMREEKEQGRSICDFLPSVDEGWKAPFGVFAISVTKKSKSHHEGCSCPACSNQYEEMVGKTVRLTLAEAASAWLDRHILSSAPEGLKIIKPAVGYSSCPDHSLKEDIIRMLEKDHGKGSLGISLSESYAMNPEASICGLIFMHPEASYPEIRNICREQYESYIRRRGMDEAKAARLLSHLLKNVYKA